MTHRICSNIGIVDFALTLPEKRMSVEDVSRLSGEKKSTLIKRLGFRSKPIVDTVEQMDELILIAIKKLLKKTQIHPMQLNFILHVGNGLSQKRLVSQAAFFQTAINANNAWASELTNGCSALVTGVNMAKYILAGSTDKYGLLISGDLFSKHINYCDISNLPFFSSGDAAIALLIGKDTGSNRILNNAHITNGAYYDSWTIDNNTNYLYLKPTIDRIENKRLLIDGYCQIIQMVLKQAAMQMGDMRYILLGHNSISVREEVFGNLSIGLDQRVDSCLTIGHLANIDPFYDWSYLRKKENLCSGDHILIATSGVGYHFGGMIVRI